jgi:radical SAM protein with 4Fe4S-binding SPASM domain
MPEYTPYRAGHHFVKRSDPKLYGEAYADYRRKWETYPKEQRITDFPINVDLELASMCNLRCPMCHTLYIEHPSYEAFEKQDMSRFMSMETFARAIDEGVGYQDFSAIKLNFRGESTLHPKIDEFIRYAKERGVLDILLNSNGNYPPELNGRLVEAGLSEISFSLDALSPEIYKKIRIGGDFFLAMSNVMAMLKYKDRIRVNVSFVHQKTNAHEADDFAKFWTMMGVGKILISDVYNPGELIGKDMLARKYAKPQQFTCPQLWQRLMVLDNGDVYPCCHAFEEPDDLNLGNIHKTPLVQIWRGEKLEKLRETHARGEYLAISTCSRCAYPKQQIPD